MDNKNLRRIALEARKELEELVAGADLGLEPGQEEDLVYTYFMKITMLKFLEMNMILISQDKLFEYMAKGIHREDYRDIFLRKMKIIARLNNKIYREPGPVDRQLLGEDFFSMKFFENLNNEKLITREEWKRIEIIGWLYQNFMAPAKEKISHKSGSYTREESQLATQLFTPKWLVEYMVENSLGRYLIETDPNYYYLKDRLDYYLHNESSYRELEKRQVRLEDISCIDLAMGTGNILVHCFEFLFQLYREAGYDENLIGLLILENNLYGVELDERVYNIAFFSILVKAELMNPGFFRRLYFYNLRTREKALGLNIVCMESSQDPGLYRLYTQPREREFLDMFLEAKTYGSLSPLKKFTEKDLDGIQARAQGGPYEDQVRALLDQYRILNSRYTISICNPPYMGRRHMDPKLRRLLDRSYENFKYDSFSAFIALAASKVYPHGHLAFMTPYVWMFIKSHEGLRRFIVDQKSISSLVQLHYSGYGGATVPICSFSLRNRPGDLEGEYVRLTDFKAREEQAALLRQARWQASSYRYSRKMENFSLIEEMPISYWVDEKIYQIFREGQPLRKLASPRQGLATGDNKSFLSYWYEVDVDSIGFSHPSIESFHKSKKTYAPYNKGGRYRKWYGNFSHVIKFDRPSYERLRGQGNKLPSRQYYFKEGLSWSFVSSSYFSVRYSPRGSVFDVGGSSIFMEEDYIFYVLAILSSKLAQEFMAILNPSLNYQVGDLARLPIIIDWDIKEDIDRLVQEAIKISQEDWDMFEQSYNFKASPLLGYGPCFVDSLGAYIGELERRFYRLKEIEEEINRKLIRSYGLEGRLDPSLKNKDISLSQYEGRGAYPLRRKDILENFLSYFVACSLGRYSLDRDYVLAYKDRFQGKKYPAQETLALGAIEGRLREFLGLNFQDADQAYDLLDREVFQGDIGRYFREDFFTYHRKVYKKSIYSLERDRIIYPIKKQ